MRLRVLLTNGSKTVDLIWLKHTSSDIYYGYVGSGRDKASYHESGARHRKDKDGKLSKYSDHQPLKELSGQLLLSTFGFHRNIVESENASRFAGKKSDAVLYLDSRTLPDRVNVMFGLLEPGNFGAILPVHTIGCLLHLSIITSVEPWIYTMVCDPSMISDELPKLAGRDSD